MKEDNIYFRERNRENMNIENVNLFIFLLSTSVQTSLVNTCKVFSQYSYLHPHLYLVILKLRFEGGWFL